MTSSFASGGDLLHAKNRNQSLPSWGGKESEVCGSWFEEKQIEARLQDRQDLVSELKVVRKDQLARGRWLKESKMVQLIQQTGTFWEYMGVETDIGRCLYPEEAIYLIEMGELEVMYGELPLSLQSAQSLMLLDHYHFDQYHVYAYLARAGCKVVRHQPYLRFTKYEKQIRLDQHQAKKKKKKLKLKEDSSKMKEVNFVDISRELPKSISTDAEKEEVEVINLDNQNIDDAIKDFYMFLGEDVSGRPETASDQPEVIDISEYDKYEAESKQVKGMELSAEDVSVYELKKREYLDMFPSMLGKDFQIVHAEESDLCPENSMPQKTVYRVSLEYLNYYSKYVDDGVQNGQSNRRQMDNRGRGRGKFRGRQRNGGFQGFQGFNNCHNNSNNSWNRRRDQDTDVCGENRLSSKVSNLHNEFNQSATEYSDFDSRSESRSTYEKMVEDYISDIRREGNCDANDRRGMIEERYDSCRNFTCERESNHKNNWRQFRSEKEDRLIDGENNWAGDRSDCNRSLGENKHCEYRQMIDTRMERSSWEDSNISIHDEKERNVYDGRVGIGEDIYFKGGKEVFDGERRNMRRENSSDWRDEIGRERKMSRLGTEDRWERTDVSLGKRLDAGRQCHKYGQMDSRGMEEASWHSRDDNDTWSMDKSEIERETEMFRQENRDYPCDKRRDERLEVDSRQMDCKNSEAAWHQRGTEMRGTNRYGERRADDYMQRPEAGHHEDRMNDRRVNEDNKQYERRAGWDFDGREGRHRLNTFRSEGMFRGDARFQDYRGVAQEERVGPENRWPSDATRKLSPDWHQHDDRWSSPGSQESSTVSSSQMLKEPVVDLTVVPHWKTRRRKKKGRERFDYYPSYLVKLPVNVASWKEYKNIVNSMSEDKMLTQGLGQALWRGPTTPLIKPAMATNVQSILKTCSFFADEDAESTNDTRIVETPLMLHFDVYLPNVMYKKSSPSVPGRRISVIRDGIVPSLNQVEEVTKRFPDEAQVVCAVVVSGEVRLYTLLPVVIPSPKPT